jgi:hypothetical protein
MGEIGRQLLPNGQGSAVCLLGFRPPAGDLEQQTEVLVAGCQVLPEFESAR